MGRLEGSLLVMGVMTTAAGSLAAVTQGSARTAWIVVLTVLFVVSVLLGVVVLRRPNSDPEESPSPPPSRPRSSALSGTHILDYTGHIDTTADAVASESRIERWRGTAKHRPGVRSEHAGEPGAQEKAEGAEG